MIWRKKKKTNVETAPTAGADDAESNVVAAPTPIVGTVLDQAPASVETEADGAVETREDKAVSGRIDLKTRRVTIDKDKT